MTVRQRPRHSSVGPPIVHLTLRKQAYKGTKVSDGSDETGSGGRSQGNAAADGARELHRRDPGEHPGARSRVAAGRPDRLRGAAAGRGRDRPPRPPSPLTPPPPPPPPLPSNAALASLHGPP